MLNVAQIQALIFVRRRRWLVVLVAAACVLTFVFGAWKPAVPPPPDGQVAQPIDWGPSQAKSESPALPELNVGAYVTNINNIDLLDDQFTIEMLLWTEWSGDPAANPSDELMVLNGIYDGDIQRFERVSRENRPLKQLGVCIASVHLWLNIGGFNAIPLIPRFSMSMLA